MIADERQKRQMAESVAQGCKTQQSQLAKDKYELEQKVKRLEGSEGDLRKMSELIKKLESSNFNLRVCHVLYCISKKLALNRK